MTDKIELLDISHHNTVIDWNKLASKVQGIYIKFSQNIDYKDPKAQEHYANARSVGLKVGAYHFVTNNDGIKQYKQFVKCMGDLQFQLAPMMDCEAYTSINASYKMVELPTNRNYLVTEIEQEYPVLELRYGNINQAESEKMGELLGYTYPTEAVVDVLGMRLAGFQGFSQPIIYTNPSSGNKIFKSKSMKKYPIMIAHWGVSKPTLPTVWKDEEYYSWQDGVYNGDPYGVLDKVDHQFWGNKVPFPGEPTPPPPPPPTGEMYVVAYPKEGKFEGSIKKA